LLQFADRQVQFFGAESLEVARLSREAGRPYVTIDCGPDSALQGPGLVIFTFGSEDILYCRGRGTIRHLKPFKVAPKSTLGAGDVFRGGVVHGVVRGMEDEAIVRFAAATAACACLRFPMAYDPPSLEEITSLAATAAG
jgi:sugar/nucleoside kinase (ribokinase family)